MKPKYIVTIVLAVLLVAGVMIALENKKLEYMDFNSAQSSGRRVQIAGTWVKEKGATYDPASNQFRFTMRDGKGAELPVVLDGARPNNFEISTSIVATGIVENSRFHASNILTKCPSKYESNGKELNPYNNNSRNSDGSL
ncbi:MAG TPA: cytochrome c maturation protein CcmE [Candidatus Kapabacteria bacterium]|nr:cytochrome c maturation protein CcmE [Candidatus Kapabacteria bacterium]